MLNILKRIFHRNYRPLNNLFLNKENLLFNLTKLQNLNKNIQIAPVLKANAYGIGLKDVSQILKNNKLPFFCVDSIFEAYNLLKSGTNTTILIMGSVDSQNIRFKKLPFSYAIYDLELANCLNKYQPGCEVHIFVDTGMCREGIPLNNLPIFIEELRKFTNIKVVGLMSHLSCPKDIKFTNLQLKNFLKAKDLTRNLNIQYFHLGGTDLVENNIYPKLDSINVLRSGIGLTGVNNKGLRPILKIVTKITQIKKISKGDRVGYGNEFLAPKEMVIGILPIGYSDGVDRALSNKGVVKIGNKYCKIIGLISMNITTVDLSNIKNPLIGQEVVIFSVQPKDKNSISKSAKLIKKSPYELLVNINPSIKRVVV
jgi:alanine racemase